MILFSIGLPTRFAIWCDRLLTGLADRSFGSALRRDIDNFDELAAATIASNALCLVACSRQPVVRLQSAISEAKKPFLVALGDPRAALRELVEKAGFDVAKATRAVASSCATMLTLTGAPRALIISAGDTLEPLEIAVEIARHFGFTLTEDEVARIVDSVADFIPAALEDVENTWWDQLSEQEQAIISGALEPYIAHFAGGAMGPLVWEPGLFLAPVEGAGSVPVNGPIDATGRARFLVHGPYINLPPGGWEVTLVLAFSAEAAGVAFIVEIAAGKQLAYTRVTPAREEVIDVKLAFAIEDSAVGPVEIRIVTDRAVFDGRLALGYATLTRREAVRNEVHAHLTETLRR